MKAKQNKSLYPMSIETFRDLGNYDIFQMKQDEPSCFNGMIRIKRYKVTIELIHEPIELYTTRLQWLWEHSDNYHHHDPLMAIAKELGIKLIGSRGSKVKKGIANE